ncbi:DUF2505 domain-containing protein [Pseudonocardia asaccharolytica]|uniref:DUF2505 domain-containing protein n=1 Tax=Pseudonocardia asaccharolytica DSM 44247 = NBRC 16224 TaxID=1123024 RepID=A0A511CZL2_9PSEU|nr:DUF2505 domain-containing protein [Pseudonocardia asaccharolytica]GEL17985.1 hypothetical protein PA7_18220 [Pseudonocardia asaccharolytica DSM 44247 = NBRC 16224]
MARQIFHRSTSTFPADKVYAVMVDPDQLQARLDELGGPGAALLVYAADDGGVRYRLRHGIDPSRLPPMLQNLAPTELRIERTEALRPVGPGRYAGTVGVEIVGTPASITGTLRLTDTAEGSEFVIDGTVTVKVPLIGGKMEGILVEHVQDLLASETAFTQEWLARTYT